MTQATAALLPAATVLVVRDSLPPAATGDIEVLLVRRSHRASFMANAFVFPGGRVDAADALAAPESEVAVAPHTVDPMQAVRRAAARELAEEVGLQVADLAQLVPFAHWITPSAEPKRFDTEFFLWPLGRTDTDDPAAVKVDDSEVFDPLWITPAAALVRYAEGTLNLPPPTVCTLEDLAAEVRAAQSAGSLRGALLPTLLTRCAARRPFAVLPKFCAEPDGALSIVMPWDAQYAELPGDGAPVPALAAAAAPVARRIRRCQLRPLSSRPASGLGASYAAATGAPPGSAGATRATDLSVVPWTVERAET